MDRAVRSATHAARQDRRRLKCERAWTQTVPESDLYDFFRKRFLRGKQANLDNFDMNGQLGAVDAASQRSSP